MDEGGTRDEGGRFVKGVSGNPAGRPRTSVAALWRRLNSEVDPEDDAPDKRTRAERLYFKVYGAAMGGSIQAAALILDRTEGKPRQTVTLTVQERDRLEATVSGLMEEIGCSREEAIGRLAPLVPEVSQLSN
jgi:hypothetical protein